MENVDSFTKFNEAFGYKFGSTFINISSAVKGSIPE